MDRIIVQGSYGDFFSILKDAFSDDRARSDDMTVRKDQPQSFVNYEACSVTAPCCFSIKGTGLRLRKEERAIVREIKNEV